MNRTVVYCLLLCACVFARSVSAQEDPRCYPGSPNFILRELLHGNSSPEAYVDAVLDYARRNCRDGQVLKLVSPAGRDETDALNQQIALGLCDAETIMRERLGSGERALIVHCLVSKLAPEPAR